VERPPKKPPTRKEFAAILAERDSFKLAIRGQSALEDTVNAAIIDAFVGVKPKLGELGSFDRRLKLAVALGIVGTELEKSLRALADLRNEFAHGKFEDLTLVRARKSLDLARLPSEVQVVLEHAEARVWLKVALLFAHSELCASIEFAKREREEARTALALQRLRGEQLSGFQRFVREIAIRESASKHDADPSS
jgi:hypothetical protein